MGSSLLALRAGATPKIIPTTKETPKARRIEFTVTVEGKKLLIIKLPEKPMIIPTVPPIDERIMASNKN